MERIAEETVKKDASSVKKRKQIIKKLNLNHGSHNSHDNHQNHRSQDPY